MLSTPARRRADDGFTLIELLMVIVIMGVLAGIVVFSVKGITNKGEASACNSEVSTVDTAEEAAYAQNGAYVANMADLVTAGFLHSAPKYVASYDTTTQKAVLITSPPSGCTAA